MGNTDIDSIGRYANAYEFDKKRMFNMVASAKDVTQLMQPKESTRIKISL